MDLSLINGVIRAADLDSFNARCSQPVKFSTKETIVRRAEPLIIPKPDAYPKGLRESISLCLRLELEN
jgi:hypothetical protein